MRNVKEELICNNGKISSLLKNVYNSLGGMLIWKCNDSNNIAAQYDR